jgi:hypothetical protein
MSDPNSIIGTIKVSGPGDIPRIVSDDEAASAMIVAQASGAPPGNVKVFLASFDGTDNDLTATQSGDKFPTNVSQLSTEYDSAAGSNPNYYLAGRYVAGPGTEGTPVGSEGVMGPVTEAAVAAANNAYSALVTQAQAWLATGGSVQVYLDSFSRGDAAAAIFSQMLFEQGIVVNNKVLVAPGRMGVEAGILFDPVTSGDLGNLAFAPDDSHLVDIQAANEYRSWFAATDYTSFSNIKTVSMDGNHADIGGGYDNGIDAITLQAATNFFDDSGLPGLSTSTLVPSRTPDTSQVYVHQENYAKGTILYPTYGSYQAGSSSQTPRAYATDPPTPGEYSETGRVVTQWMTTQSGDYVRIVDDGTNETCEIKKLVTSSGTQVSDTFTHYNTSSSGTVVADVVTETLLPSGVGVYLINNAVAKVQVDYDNLVVNVDAASSESLSVQAVSGVNLDTATISIVVASQDGQDTTLTGGSAVGTTGRQWRGADGTTYTFSAPLFSPSSLVGTLTVSGGAEGGAQLSIANFSLASAENDPNGYLGIQLARSIALQGGATANDPLQGGSLNASPVAIGSEASKAFTVFASVVDTLAQAVTFVISGGNPAAFMLSNGSDLIPFVNGQATVSIAPGQDSATLSLVNVSDPGASEAISLSATLDATSDSTAASSNSLTFDFTEQSPSSTQFTVLSGVADHANPLQTDYFDLSPTSPTNWLIDAAAPTLNFIQILGVGNDSIVGSAGNDSIGTGNGNSTVSGGGGQDEILVGNGSNVVYANSVANLATAIGQGQTGSSTGLQGSLLGTWNGNNTVVGGNGNDLILVGQGNNVIVAGPGNDTIQSGDGIYGAAPIWSTQNALIGGSTQIVYNGVNFLNTLYTSPSDYEGPLTTGGQPAVGVGNSTIYGGRGNSYIFTSNGDNYVDAGGGNDLAGR